MSIKSDARPIEEYLNALRRVAPKESKVVELISGMSRQQIEYEYSSLLLLCVNFTQSSSYILAQD